MSEATPLLGPPTLTEAKGWVGFELDDTRGARIGRIHTVFADPGDGQPAWLIAAVQERGFLRRRRASMVAIAVRECAGAAGRVWTAQGRDVLRAAPTVDPTRPLLREHELTICAHYGISERLGRAAEVVGRPAGAVTAQPA